MSSSQHFTIIFPTRKPRLLLADINNVNAAVFILLGWWFAHATGTRSGHCELQTAAEALHCQGWLMRRGEVGRKILLLNLLGLSPLRGWPPKCGLRTSLWPQLCYPTCSRENANTSEKLSQGKVVKKKKITYLNDKRKLQRSCVAPCTKTTSGAQPPSAGLHSHLCQTL